MKPEEVLKWLKYDKDKFLEAIAPFVQVKPWKCDSYGGSETHTGMCVRCGAVTEYTDTDCTIPPPVTDCLEKVAWMMRDRCDPDLWLAAFHYLQEQDENLLQVNSTPPHWIVATLIAEVSNAGR